LYGLISTPLLDFFISILLAHLKLELFDELIPYFRMNVSALHIKKTITPESYRATRYINIELKSDVSEISSVSIIKGRYSTSTLMMEADVIFETLVFISTSTRQIFREDFSICILHESFKPYMK
jgi:hypothetical protein